jgi:hypothetical protein
MKITAEELKRAYHDMSDQELLSMHRGELTDVALRCHDQELARRDLRLQPDGEPALGVDDDEEVCAGAFRFPDEAQLVQELLESEGIPARLDNHLGDLFWMGSTSYQSSRVFVPAPMLDKAQSIIEGHATEEELAAQAEADGPPVVVLARYEHGVFKPIDPIELEAGTEVEVHLPKTS